MMLAQMDEQKKKAMAEEGALEMEKSLKRIKRVVERGDSAVIIFSKKEWATYIREGGLWKSDD